MLMQEHWRCGYFAGEGIPESPAGQRECVTAGCPTGQVSKGKKMKNKYMTYCHCNVWEEIMEDKLRKTICLR